MVSMPWVFSAAMCSGRSRRASRPPCTIGCRVLTRPSSISGKPVSSATSVTGSFSSASSLAVPPVEISLMPRACSARAKSTMPVLSETEIRAFMRVFGFLGWGATAGSLDQFVFDEFFAQGVAVQAQPFGRALLVVVSVLHHPLQQRLFDHTHHHVVHAVRFGAAQVLEI